MPAPTGCAPHGRPYCSTCRAAQLRADGARRQREAEEQVLAGAARLDLADDSLTARQIRATAESIRDHREAAARR